jgi:hypothetical protein
MFMPLGAAMLVLLCANRGVVIKCIAGFRCVYGDMIGHARSGRVFDHVLPLPHPGG